MRAGCTRQVASIAAGLIALGAQADVVGGASVTVTSATGFVPVTWSEPTNGYGWSGSGRDRGDAWVPFAGWVDFGLLGGQRVTVDWDFSQQEPHRWLAWSITRLGGEGSPIAGVEWSGESWRPLGETMFAVAESGSVTLQLAADGGRHDYRLAFSGVSVDPESGGIGAVTFAVPAPASITLVALAFVAARRRREVTV